MPIHLSNEQQEGLITPLEAIAAIERGIRLFANGDAIRRPRIDNILPTSRPGEFFNFSSMEGGLRGPGYYALRVKPDIYAFPADAQGRRRNVTYSYRPGLYGGMVFLYATDTAELLAFMNDGFIQHLRTAATGALGARHLARPDSRVLGIVGSGGMARFFARTMSAVRPIERIQVWSPTPANLARYVEEVSRLVDAEVVAVADARAAVRGADIVCCCTTSREPVIKAEWLEPGTHLNNVVPMELGPDVYARIDTAGIWVDRPALRLGGFTDPGIGITSASLGYFGRDTDGPAGYPRGATVDERYPNATYAVCGDVATSSARRRGEITILANCSYGIREGDGMVSGAIQGVQFAVVGGAIYERAAAAGIGTPFPRELFLQDMPT